MRAPSPGVPIGGPLPGRPAAARQPAVAKKLSAYTGLTEDYLRKANLRVSLGMFMQELTLGDSVVTGRYDSRYTGPATDLLAERPDMIPITAPSPARLPRR